jgi:hypothetical protein
MKPGNQTQALLDHESLGRIETSFEGRGHELVVDYDIGSHDV